MLVKATTFAFLNGVAVARSVLDLPQVLEGYASMPEFELLFSLPDLQTGDPPEVRN